MRDYRNLKVWEKAHELVLDIYLSTMRFPDVEKFGLTSQTWRSAISVAANIAEGYGRSGDAELGRFISIAQGSSSELPYHLLLAKDLGYISHNACERLDKSLTEVQEMLRAFKRTLQITA